MNGYTKCGLYQIQNIIPSQEILAHIATWMNLENIQSEINQTQKDKYSVIPVTCGI